MASLVFVAGPNAGRRYTLIDGENIIGRHSDCQVFVPDMRVSRQHARVIVAGGKVRVEDLGSNNGTFVNGSRIQGAAELSHNDEMQVATNRIRVDLPAADAAASRVTAEQQLTLVESEHSAVWRSREDTDASRSVIAGASRSAMLGASMSTIGGSADARALRRSDRKVEALTSILQASATATDADQLIEKMVDALLQLYPQAESVGVLVEDARSGELRVQCQRHRRRDFSGALRVPGTIITHVVADRRGVLLGDASGVMPSMRGATESSDPEIDVPDGAGAAIADGEGVGTRMGAPLLYQGTHYGVVYVESTGRHFYQEDVDLLGTIAAQTGLAIHAARMAEQLAKRERLERDLGVARQIQRSLLPASPPEVVGLDFAIHYEPAYQIGGDFYDFIWHDQSHLGLLVGDVAGKAISAALYMARLTSELRSRAGIARTPARLLRRVNAEMVPIGDDGMFATLIYCIYDLETRSLVFTNAGHCVPLLRRGDRVFPLHAERAHIAPMGVMHDLEAGEARVQLMSGDMLVLVSDGILEARDPRGQEYGVSRLSRRIRTARGSCEDVVKSILQDVDAHVGQGPQADDMTILTMAIDERRARRKTSTLPGIAVDDVGRPQTVAPSSALAAPGTTATPPLGSPMPRVRPPTQG